MTAFAKTVHLPRLIALVRMVELGICLNGEKDWESIMILCLFVSIRHTSTQSAILLNFPSTNMSL
jgi:hypothetical protein